MELGDGPSGDGWIFEQRAESDADREDVLLDSIVQGTGDALAFAAEQLDLLRLGQALMELLELRDHSALALVQPGVVDSNGNLARERRQELLVARAVADLLVGDTDHPDHRIADSERDAEEAPNRGMSVRLPDAVGVVGDVVGDVRAVLSDHDPDDAGANCHLVERAVELRVRIEASDGRHVHDLVGHLDLAGDDHPNVGIPQQAGERELGVG